MPEGRGIEAHALTASLLGASALALCFAVAADAAAAPPEIRVTERNRVPQCVTPEKLTRFLETGNQDIEPKFRGIARFYKEHGERLRVRWDYAFFQMVVETNYLKFANNKGKGDVSPKQNNFAGIGTTGGGVPGDSFPDVSTGVLGQMQHLVAYSGEPVANPVAPRTRDKQDDIIKASLKLRRPPTFKDLAGRWAVDKRYATTIEGIAERFRAEHCNGREPELVPAVAQSASKSARPAAARAAAPDAVVTASLADRSGAGAKAAVPKSSAGSNSAQTKAVQTTAASEAKPAQAKSAPQASCTVQTASYGGEKNLLIRSFKGAELQLTALQVLTGQETALASAFISSHAAGGETIGEFPNRDAALRKAFALCPEAKR